MYAYYQNAYIKSIKKPLYDSHWIFVEKFENVYLTQWHQLCQEEKDECSADFHQKLVEG